MSAYSKLYLNDVVENQGKLFDLVANEYPMMDTEDFINAYMMSKTRKAIDESQAYVNTMDPRTLWEYFVSTEGYYLKSGDETLGGFFPMWLGEFYSYYQWYYNISSAEIIHRLPIKTMKRIYVGLCDLPLEKAVQKVGCR